jgi:class 3 adenylate cyclase
LLFLFTFLPLVPYYHFVASMNSGHQAKYLGRGDLHETKYQSMGIQHSFFDLFSPNGGIQSQYTGIPVSKVYCPYSIAMYPSKEMERQFTSFNPIIFATGVVLIFVFTSFVFILYDSKVEQRQRNLMATAIQSTAVLSSLFPSKIRDKLLSQEFRLIDNNETASKKSVHSKRASPLPNDPGQNPMGLGISFDSVDMRKSYSKLIKKKFASPIADLYPNTTVFFADICGFTAWSSSRGPDDVFMLLESLYCEFDKIARRRQIFKVETIGDSYVAAAGLPEPMSHHATVMSKFAEEVLQTMNIVVNELSSCFGPDTATLTLRVGLNSGPTTAGVIRGEKSRFQLFGDTVNTAARMESTGIPGKIQCTSKTAELIRKSGKGHWLQQREDVVEVKGKGEMTTYWIQIRPKCSQLLTSDFVSWNDCDSRVSDSDPCAMGLFNVSCKRLVEWNMEVLQSMILDLLLFRQRQSSSNRQLSTGGENKMPTWETETTNGQQYYRLPLDEVVEVLNLTETSWDRQLLQHVSAVATLDAAVKEQLAMFISDIATKYQSNPFHNFEHASHVVMSTKSLLDRVDKPSTDTNSNHLNLDPLVRLAIVFGALVHDVDHLGVPNSQLTKEQSPTAVLYKDRCVAEQNSFDLAWKTFMQPQFVDLRQCIFQNEYDYDCFRQVMLNVVMATDIFDKDLKALRQKRWDKVFASIDPQKSLNLDEQPVDSIDEHNRKATICIEHLIQASDVIHTMQHWTVYQKWNRKLFVEMNRAYQDGRLETNPCTNWYEGELWFFDNYIIPLANKLKLCGVFGANSAVFFDFATDNRIEWESKGRAIVLEWLEYLEALDETYATD